MTIAEVFLFSSADTPRITDEASPWFFVRSTISMLLKHFAFAKLCMTCRTSFTACFSGPEGPSEYATRFVWFASGLEARESRVRYVCEGLRYANKMTVGGEESMVLWADSGFVALMLPWSGFSICRARRAAILV